MLSSLDLALVVSELRPFTASVLTSTDNGFFFFFFFFPEETSFQNLFFK